MFCPACERPIGRFHRTPNGFHRDCFKHWLVGYNVAAKFCEEENRMAGYPAPAELYRRRCTPIVLGNRKEGQDGSDSEQAVGGKISP
jgi:hypothetical protein